MYCSTKNIQAFQDTFSSCCKCNFKLAEANLLFCMLTCCEVMYQGNARLQSWLLKSLLIFRPRLWTDQNHYTDLQTKTAQNPYPLKRYIHVHVSSISFNKEETTRLWGQSFWLLVVSISYVIVCHRVMHLWNMRLTRKPKLQWMP